MKRAFLFPGQGAQLPGMGKDFYDHFALCKETFQEADDILGRHLSKIIFEGPLDLLTETRNSQTGIYVVSMAIGRLLAKDFPEITAHFCAGLSLGEYSALTAAGKIDFATCLPLVEARAEAMNEACLATKGGMSVVMGLSAEAVEAAVQELNMPHDLWVANFNCPGQVVISGTEKGVAAGAEVCKAKGAKRVLPLTVHGAFHSGLMQLAAKRLKEKMASVSFKESPIVVISNVTGLAVKSPEEIKELLVKQVTHSVRWEQSVRLMDASGVEQFIEMGPGKTLAGMNKRIETKASTISIEKIEDLGALAS